MKAIVNKFQDDKLEEKVRVLNKLIKKNIQKTNLQ